MSSIKMQILGLIGPLLTLLATLGRLVLPQRVARLGPVAHVFVHLPDGSPAPIYMIDPVTKKRAWPDHDGLTVLPIDRSGLEGSVRDAASGREVRAIILDLKPNHTMRIALEEV